MGIVERYSRSINSSDLKSDERHFDTDNLAAVALSNELGGLLFRVKYGNDATSFKSLLASWTTIVQGKCQWPKHLPAHKIAEKSLGHWLNDVCPACTGKGVQKMANVPVLDDKPCVICEGSGKKPLMCEANWRDPLLNMIDVLDRMAMVAGAEAIRKLASDMDF